MGTVMIKCPATGYSISTGLRAARADFASTPVFFSRTYCMRCRAEHEWFAKDAWVQEPHEAGAQFHCEAA